MSLSFPLCNSKALARCSLRPRPINPMSFDSVGLGGHLAHPFVSPSEFPRAPCITGTSDFKSFQLPSLPLSSGRTESKEEHLSAHGHLWTPPPQRGPHLLPGGPHTVPWSSVPQGRALPRQGMLVFSSQDAGKTSKCKSSELYIFLAQLCTKPPSLLVPKGAGGCSPRTGHALHPRAVAACVRARLSVF